MAAARIKLLPPAALLKRLERRLPLLTGGLRDPPRRQQAMRDAIAWSYDLLPAREQQLFRHLAVFVGGFDVDAAEAVIGAIDEASGVMDGIVALVDASLLRPLAQPGDIARIVSSIAYRAISPGCASGRRRLASTSATMPSMTPLASSMAPITASAASTCSRRRKPPGGGRGLLRAGSKS